MVKFAEMSALVLTLPIVEIVGQFSWKAVDYIIYTNFLRLKIIQSASEGQTKRRREINEPEGNLTLYTNIQGNSTTKSVLANKIDGTWANWKVHKENKDGKH